MKKTLFSDFPSVSEKQWKQKIQADLKGADYDSLIFHSAEGIDVKPFYHRTDLKESYAPESPENWVIYEHISVRDEEKSVAQITKALEKGTEGLWLKIHSEKIDIGLLLNGLKLEKVPVFIEFDFLSADYISGVIDLFSDKDHAVSIGIDSIGHLAETGNWFQNRKKDFEAIERLFSETDCPIRFVISGDIYQNAGATVVQQLTYALAHANEYLNFMNERFPEKGKRIKPLFKFAVGSNYFFEIAKLKAMRSLYATLAEAYGFGKDLELLVFPTRRNKTLYDYNINLLRTTTESMSGVLGGADGVCNFPYDGIYHEENEFGNRIARNQLLILKEESHFDKVANPADGSYYIESLIRQFADAALTVFKSIEKSGGFLNQLKAGKIQQKIKESAQKEQDRFDKGEQILVGTNKYQNPEDRMKNELERDPFLKQNPRKTFIEPILPKRLAEKSEQDRLKDEA